MAASRIANIVVAIGCFLIPQAAWSQSVTTGSIAGVVRDPSGAVLPGVTVEAASPALIEKIRTAVTDQQGNYKIVDLRPGVYTVTFTLAGFSARNRLARTPHERLLLAQLERTSDLELPGHEPALV